MAYADPYAASYDAYGSGTYGHGGADPWQQHGASHVPHSLAPIPFSANIVSPRGPNYYHTDQSSLMHGEYIDPAHVEGKKKTGGRHALAAKAGHGVCCGCCCCTLLVSLIASCIVGHFYTRRHHDWEQPLGINCPGEEFCLFNEGTNIPPNNVTRYLAWNGCRDFKGYLTDETINMCGPPCYDSKLVGNMDNFNKASPWRYVQFPSRVGVAGQQQLTLTAWWLPADPMFAEESPDKMIPVVILQHGNNANFNSRMVQAYAYLLRSIGFSVFLPNLRDHGSSQKSAHSSRVTWGYDYYLDLLGAWDYVIEDPDGIFGGKRKSSAVGIAGMSMGAYVAATVAGLNHEIPGVWLDSGVYDANYGELGQLLRSYGDYIWLGWLTAHLRAPTWFFASWWAGVDIGYKQPSNSLTCDTKPSSGIPTKVALISNHKDTFVHSSETSQFNMQMGKNPDCYQIIESWEASSECHGEHCSMVFQYPEVYRRKACQFWSNVFGRPEAVCNLAALPLFSPVMMNMTLPAKETSSLGSWGSGSSASLDSVSGSASSEKSGSSSGSSSSGSFADSSGSMR